MNIQRFIGILITTVIVLTSCSQQVSKIEYDRKVYEYSQLKIRYDLLVKEVDGGVTSRTTTPNNTNTTAKIETETKAEAVPSMEVEEVIAEINPADYEQLKQDYEQLLKEHSSLKTAYDTLKISENETKPVPPGTVSKVVYNELQEEKITLERQYAILENRYNTLKKIVEAKNSSSVASAEIIEPATINPDLNVGKGNLEENSIDLGVSIVQSASFNGLFFDFDAYERTQEQLVLEIAVKNNSQNNLRTFWDAEDIQIVNVNDSTYTASNFRIGVDYANDENYLVKKIKDENTVFARFIFKELPNDFKQIKSLKFIVYIDGEERIVEFTQINISQIAVE